MKAAGSEASLDDSSPQFKIIKPTQKVARKMFFAHFNLWALLNLTIINH